MNWTKYEESKLSSKLAKHTCLMLDKNVRGYSLSLGVSHKKSRHERGTKP